MDKHDLELMLLGAILEDPEAINKTLQIEDLFFSPKMKKIWRVILYIYRNGHKISELNLATEMDKMYKGLLTSRDISRAKALYEMSGDVKDIIQKIKEKYAISMFRNELKTIESSLERGSLVNIIEKHKKSLISLQELYQEKSKSVARLVDGAMEDLRRGSNVIPFGITYLDDFAGGLTRGEISSLGGRPGDGKTTFALFIAMALVKKGLKVLFINRELKNEAALQRLIVMNSKELTIQDFRTPKIGSWVLEETEKNIKDIKENLGNLIFVDNISTLSESISEIRRVSPDVFIDDYIQMIRTDYSHSKERRFVIEDIMFSYKWLAKELNITGIVLSQLSRDIEKRIDKTPVMSDLSEGASIEHYSENVMFIRKIPDVHKSNLVIAKSRWGRTGIYEIGSRLERCKYYETFFEAETA